jgi:hypothetical protein
LEAERLELGLIGLDDQGACGRQKRRSVCRRLRARTSYDRPPQSLLMVYVESGSTAFLRLLLAREPRVLRSLMGSSAHMPWNRLNAANLAYGESLRCRPQLGERARLFVP